MALQTPKEFEGRFQILSELNSRPGCTVYRAADKTLGGREVALKVFADRPNGNAEWIKSFGEELNGLRAASHQALVPIIAGGCFEDWFYIAMELIESQTLYDLLKQESRVPLEKAVQIVRELAGGLAELHNAKLFHGHVDSRAVLFKKDAPRLAGYYPATVEAILRSTTSQGRISIDPNYVAPEQIQGGAIDGRADIYALGVLLFEMATGQRPFAGSNPLQTAMARLSQQPPSPRKLNPEISPLLDAAILKALARDPKDRFQQAADFVDAATGGKETVKNPFVGREQPQAEPLETGTQTIAVSMSTDAIKDLLRSHDVQSKKTVAPAPEGAPQQLDVESTMVGMQAIGSANASLIIIKGVNRGRRFQLDKPQAMIGSDSSCDVCLEGKNIPRRYGLVVKRDTDYYAESLGGAPLTINGRSESSDEGVKLQRGDTITAGDTVLRFVAAGEVFTLHDEVADRTVDRPPSRAPMFVGVLAVILIVLAFGGVHLYRQSAAEQRARAQKAIDERNAQREAKIAQLSREGDEFMKKQAFSEPVGANAQERFRAVLDLNPDDTYAKRRLAELGEIVKKQQEEAARRALFAQKISELLEDGDRLFKSSQYVSPPGRNAREIYQEVLKIDPQNKAALEGVAKIDEILGDIVGRVNTLLAQGRDYVSRDQYVLPKGENAYESYRQVLAIDPDNKQAKEALLDMAAQKVFQGEQARDVNGDYNGMTKAFITAKAVGADPAYIDLLQKRGEILKRTGGSQVVVVAGQEEEFKPSGPGYLDTAEIRRRVEVLRAQNPLSGSSVFRNYVVGGGQKK